jgi:hypothetical protein
MKIAANGKLRNTLAKSLGSLDLPESGSVGASQTQQYAAKSASLILKNCPSLDQVKLTIFGNP